MFPARAIAALVLLRLAPALAQPRLEQWTAVRSDGNARVAMPAPSKPGDLIIVVAGSQSPGCVISDTAGNTYTAADGPLMGPGVFIGYYQQLFYAENITAAPGPLQLTVACSAAEPRILEYSGVARVGALDQANGATGMGTFADSGVVTPSAPGELIVGAVLSFLSVQSPGVGFIDELDFEGDMVEDLVDPLQAPIAATATTDPPWIVQVATFRADSSIDAGPPLALFADGGVNGSFTALQWNGGESTVGTVSIPLVNAASSGTVLMVCLSSTDPDAGISDDSGDTYVLVSEAPGMGALVGRRLKLFYARNIAGGPNRNITLISTSNGLTTMQVAEYQGVDTALPFDGTGFGVGSAGSTTLSASLTNTAAADLVVACGASAGAVGSPGPGLNARQLLGGNLMMDGDAPAGTISVSATSNDPNWIFVLGGFHRLGFDGGLGMPDGGGPDAGTPDAGGPDAGANDAGASDAGVADAGPLDAGAQDGGSGPDGGPAGPRLVSVGCGCQSALAGWQTLALMMLICRRAGSRRRWDGA